MLTVSGAFHLTHMVKDLEAATRIYADAHQVDPEFYAFVRSLESYRKAIDEHTTLVLSPEAEFFRFLEGAGPSAPAPAE